MEFLKPEEAHAGAFELEVTSARLEALLKPGWWERKQDIAQVFSAFGCNYAALKLVLGKAVASGTAPSLQGAQSFLVHDGGAFALRLNLWFPEKEEFTGDRYRKYLSINEMHNHDFDFFTMCLSGPGYTSNFWRDACHSFDRQKGERLDLRAPNTVILKKGEVLFVEKDLDYHSQQWPAAFTTTLNLIPKISANAKRVQYLVDSSTHKILDVVRGEM